MRTELRRLSTVPASTRLTPAALDALFVCHARVCGLLNTCRPAYVPRLVVAVVVAAVKREFWRWPSAYVSNEVRKTVAPAFTYMNSTRTVILERLVLRVMATLNHRLIHLVFLGRTQAMCARLRLAATRLRQSDAEIANEDISFDTAHAAASKKSQPVAARCFAEDRPVPHQSAHRNWASQRVDVLGRHNRHNRHSVTLNGDFAWT